MPRGIRREHVVDDRGIAQALVGAVLGGVEEFDEGEQLGVGEGLVRLRARR